MLLTVSINIVKIFNFNILIVIFSKKKTSMTFLAKVIHPNKSVMVKMSAAA